MRATSRISAGPWLATRRAQQSSRPGRSIALKPSPGNAGAASRTPKSAPTAEDSSSGASIPLTTMERVSPDVVAVPLRRRRPVRPEGVPHPGERRFGMRTVQCHRRSRPPRMDRRKDRRIDISPASRLDRVAGGMSCARRDGVHVPEVRARAQSPGRRPCRRQSPVRGHVADDVVGWNRALASPSTPDTCGPRRRAHPGVVAQALGARHLPAPVGGQRPAHLAEADRADQPMLPSKNLAISGNEAARRQRSASARRRDEDNPGHAVPGDAAQTHEVPSLQPDRLDPGARRVSSVSSGSGLSSPCRPNASAAMTTAGMPASTAVHVATSITSASRPVARSASQRPGATGKARGIAADVPGEAVDARTAHTGDRPARRRNRREGDLAGNDLPDAVDRFMHRRRDRRALDGEGADPGQDVAAGPAVRDARPVHEDLEETVVDVRRIVRR